VGGAVDFVKNLGSISLDDMQKSNSCFFRSLTSLGTFKSEESLFQPVPWNVNHDSQQVPYKALIKLLLWYIYWEDQRALQQVINMIPELSLPIVVCGMYTPNFTKSLAFKGGCVSNIHCVVEAERR